MRRVLPLLVLLAACATPAPPPASAPAPPEEPAPRPVATAPAPQEERVIGKVRVTASALNVRAEASTDADAIAQVKKGTALDVLSEDASWVKVRLAGGETGWVAARFVSKGGTAKKIKGKCPPDSDYAFDEAPRLAFSEGGPHGVVVVEAKVNAQGRVTSTRVVSNGTGDETLAFLAQKEIRAARFSPPIRNCAPRAFIFTYRRSY
ncbi:MAG TPA: TonB family protein [Thermoanaerobaculia bacterium]|nr:TonB family protein [Thermoanaerobaculia bacterium]